MKRLHIHFAVEDLAANIRFYSALFGTAPTVEKDDYAKWQIEDPRVNFAISTRGNQPGLDHVGIQAEEEGELTEVKARLEAAGVQGLSQEATACCYAESDKYWTLDPQGIAWESFHTLGEAEVFSKGSQAASGACCTPNLHVELGALSTPNKCGG